MSSNSNIEWTEATWNPVAGCTPISPGCLNCYAATMSHRLDAMGQAKYRGLTVLHNDIRTFNGKISFDEAALSIPLKRKKPTTYFVNSMSDLFHEDVPFDFVDKVFAVMAMCPQHTFQVLTKRPERMAKYTESHDVGLRWAMSTIAFDNSQDRPAYTTELAVDWSNDGLPNAWLGCSPVNQKTYDEYKPYILRVPAAIRFLSLEPLLGPIELGDLTGIHWAIVGGESGPGSRPCNVEWVRSIIAQCKAAGVSCFVKQLGANADDGVPFATPTNTPKNRKGGDPEEWPADLRVREMPEVSHA